MSVLFKKWMEQNTAWAPLLSAPMFQLSFSFIESSLKPNSLILDLGSGDGHITALFNQFGSKSVGLDINPQMIRIASRKYPLDKFVLGKGEELPFCDSTFDLVFSNSVLQYTHRAKALTECARVLKPGGSFVFIENLKGSPVARAYRLCARYLNFKYPAYQIPRDHLRWEDQYLYEEFFSDVEYKSFNLLTPGLFVILSRLPQTPLVCRASERLYSAFHRIDRYLLDSHTLLSRYNWHCVIYGTKR